jgi:putative transposase
MNGRDVPLGLAVDGANRNDVKLTRETIESLAVERPDAPQGMCLDKGYDYDEVRELLDEFGFTAHIRARGEEAQALKQEAGFKARRWVVERTHSWMNRFRRGADPLGQESAQLPGVSAFGLCLHHVSPSWPIEIGSKEDEGAFWFQSFTGSSTDWLAPSSRRRGR